MLMSVVAAVLAVTVGTLAPSLQVTPSRTDSLIDGEQVMVSGRGFPAGAEVTVGECAPAAGCNEQGGVQLVTIDADGAFGPVPLIVAIRFAGADCARTTCEIVAAAAGVPLARARISFGSAPPTTVVPTPASTAIGPPGTVPVWVWLAGAAAVALAGVGWLATRRRDG